MTRNLVLYLTGELIQRRLCRVICWSLESLAYQGAVNDVGGLVSGI
jgi:hypothetical protein